ncbi:MAG TPA: Zn-dependent alcohol dehydrogenase [Verrucomicrobiae bacterium]|jgi:S-(hydroxymethyl)glutathione dehydrogenase / alcohol dehydrogenase|nr:Zn-dependent alcohol dehydrogenase [Verrucomicrobiae bacterium]
MRITAAVLHDVNKPYSIETVELDPPRRGEVLVKVGAAGVCRSDLHFQKGEATIALPAVLGHEGSGTVLAIGEGVTLVEPGDRVILSFVPNCGHCPSCETGRPYLCDEHARTTGKLFDNTSRLHTLAGQDLTHMGKVACFADHAVVPEAGCIPAPAGLDFPQMALIGCSVTTGVGAALFNAGVQPGDSVAVIGCGGVGVNILQGARLAGATTVVAVDVKAAALDFARKFGATHTVNARTESAVERVKAITGGGAQWAFEAFGGGATTRMAVDMLRKRGTAVIVGIAPIGDDAVIEPLVITRMEKTIRGCYYGSARSRQDMPRIADWYGRGLLDIDGLVTRRYPLADINRAYEDLDTDAVGRGVIVF